MWTGVFTADCSGGPAFSTFERMSHGHGVATFWIMLLVKHMIKDAG
jgi:hypothetical protein